MVEFCGDEASCVSDEQRSVGMQIEIWGEQGGWAEAQTCELSTG